MLLNGKGCPSRGGPIMAPIHLAVLLCDTPVPAVLKEDGDYHRIFDTWLGSVSFSVDYTLEAFDVVSKMEYPPDDAQYDGIILTGSGQSKYPPAPPTFRSDALSQPPLHTKTLNGSTSWWSILPTSCDRNRRSSCSVRPTVSLSVGQTFADHPP